MLTPSSSELFLGDETGGSGGCFVLGRDGGIAAD
jgi:hypothetical protein